MLRFSGDILVKKSLNEVQPVFLPLSDYLLLSHLYSFPMFLLFIITYNLHCFDIFIFLVVKHYIHRSIPQQLKPFIKHFIKTV